MAEIGEEKRKIMAAEAIEYAKKYAIQCEEKRKKEIERMEANRLDIEKLASHRFESATCLIEEIYQICYRAMMEEDEECIKAIEAIELLCRANQHL